MRTHAKTTTLLALLVVLMIVAGLLLSLSSISKEQKVLSVMSFADCKAAGYPIMESYPEQCRTPDGRTFVNEAQQVSTTTPGSIVASGCAIAGCSGQLCVSVSEASDIMTTCEFRAEYACYRNAKCEKQPSGTCGWTQSAELTQCLKNPPSLEISAQPVY